MMIDVNVNLSRWPVRRLKYDTTETLWEQLSSNQITQAWAGSYDGLLHKDMSEVNRRLVRECERIGREKLLPVGVINPTLPGWEEDVRQCVEVHQMRGLRLHPDYHQYEYGDERLIELLKLARGANLFVQICPRMEDERTAHRSIVIQHPDKTRLPALVQRFPEIKFILCNGLRDYRSTQLTELVAAKNVWVEIATLEEVFGIRKLLKLVPLERILFGSHAPFFYLESALLKLKESELGQVERDAICYQNALTILN